MIINKLLVVCPISLIVALILGPVIIPVLRRLKFGQEIREEGPLWHQVKSGTPTMGGFIFIIPLVICSLLFAFSKKALLVVLLSLSFGIVGFVDDYIKVVKKRNLGLSAKGKFLFQLFFSVLFVCVALFSLKLIDTKVFIPFYNGYIDFGYLYIPFAVFVLLGTTNSVNLTDGVDGLASGVTFFVSIFFAVLSYKMGENHLCLVNAILASSLLGFFAFNKHKAKVFMGDTGSLFLGGFICANALILKTPVILIIAGLVYVIETLSVIIQVAYFKKTKKRIFKMTPIHHHFEMCDWSENKIVFVFSAFTVLMCVISYFLSV